MMIALQSPLYGKDTGAIATEPKELAGLGVIQKSNAGSVEESREDQKKAINRAIGGLICVWGLKSDKSFNARQNAWP
jgi:hypothetical protein